MYHIHACTHNHHISLKPVVSCCPPQWPIDLQNTPGKYGMCITMKCMWATSICDNLHTPPSACQACTTKSTQSSWEDTLSNEGSVHKQGRSQINLLPDNCKKIGGVKPVGMEQAGCIFYSTIPHLSQASEPSLSGSEPFHISFVSPADLPMKCSREDKTEDDHKNCKRAGQRNENCKTLRSGYICSKYQLRKMEGHFAFGKTGTSRCSEGNWKLFCLTGQHICFVQVNIKHQKIVSFVSEYIIYPSSIAWERIIPPVFFIVLAFVALSYCWVTKLVFFNFLLSNSFTLKWCDWQLLLCMYFYVIEATNICQRCIKL